MLNFEFGVFHDRQIRVAKGLDVSAAVGIQSEIQNARGTISVQKDSGSFNIPLIMGKIEGLFHFQEDQVLVEITEKPFVLSCSKIEAEIAKYLSR